MTYKPEKLYKLKLFQEALRYKNMVDLIKDIIHVNKSYRKNQLEQLKKENILHLHIKII